MDEDEAPAETRQAYQQAIAEFDHRLRSEIGQPQYVEVTTDLADVLAAADSKESPNETPAPDAQGPAG